MKDELREKVAEFLHLALSNQSWMDKEKGYQKDSYFPMADSFLDSLFESGYEIVPVGKIHLIKSSKMDNELRDRIIQEFNGELLQHPPSATNFIFRLDKLLYFVLNI